MTLKEQLAKLQATKKSIQDQIAKALSDAITKGHTPNDEQEKAIKALETAAAWVGTISPEGVLAYGEDLQGHARAAEMRLTGV